MKAQWTCRIAAAMLVLWSGAARALDHVSVQMAFYPQGPQAYLFVAKELGWYETAGLDVEILDGRGSNYSMQVLSGGHADIGEGVLVPLVFARASGAPVKAIAEWFAADGPAIIVPKDSPIRGPKDLKGQRLLLTAAGPWPPLLDSLLAEGGLTQQDVSLVYVDSAGLFTTYAMGRADALMSVDLAITEADPIRPSRLLEAIDYGVMLPGNGVFATEDTIARRPDVLRRFLRVSAAALDYVYDGHADEAVAAIRKEDPKGKLDAAVLKRQIEMFAALRFLPETRGKPTGWQSPEIWQARLRYMKAAQILKRDHAPGEFYTDDLIDPGAR